jgi:hypothetical protein
MICAELHQIGVCLERAHSHLALTCVWRSWSARGRCQSRRRPRPGCPLSRTAGTPHSRALSPTGGSYTGQRTSYWTSPARYQKPHPGESESERERDRWACVEREVRDEIDEWEVREVSRYVIRIPIGRFWSSYSSWGPHKTRHNTEHQ